MNDEPASAAAPETETKRLQRRAAHACLRCRTRKVRCNVSISGIPCMNCHLDGDECEVAASRRARRRWKTKGLGAQRPTTDQQSSAPTGSDTNGDGVGERDEGLGHNEEIASFLGDPPASPDIEDAQSEPGSSRRDDPEPAAYYTGYSYYQFLYISNLEAIPPQDFRFLELEGCLHTFQPQILDEFVRQYFLHMHPILPLLDEGAFWDAYTQRTSSRKSHRKISLLLFQAMMFACCSYVPQATLSLLGLKTARAARAMFYRRAQLLFNFETESSSIIRSQAALLLASWSFSSYDVPRKPNIPWLSMAIQYAKDADAHKYEAFDDKSEAYSVRKRLWWCCVIRDRIFGLGMRRGILMAPGHFDIGRHSHLGSCDLAGECHRSLVHDADTKIRLAEILELLVELCIILTEVLQLAFPIEDRLKPGGSHAEVLGRIRGCQLALHGWHNKAAIRLPNFGTPLKSPKPHDSVVLFANLVAMYYYSTKVALGHHEILQTATNAMTATTSTSDIITLKDNHFELQDAALGITGCLEKLIHLRLVRWLPITAVSCTALPLLLHLLDVEILSSTKAADSSHSKLMKHRLGILRKAMETYQLQYEGVDWIADVINRIISLARAGSIPNTEQSRARRKRSSTSVDDWVNMLTFQPVWYLRLAFTIDVAFGKGRLPEVQVFLRSRSFRDVIMAEIRPSADLLEEPIDDAREVQQQTIRPRNGAQAATRASPSTQVNTTDVMYYASPEDDSGWGGGTTEAEKKPVDGCEEELGDAPNRPLDLTLDGDMTLVAYEHHMAEAFNLLAQCGCEGPCGNDIDIALSL